MLAYVFWHWPNSSIARSSYEELQRAFHAALAAGAPAGFLSSCVFRLEGYAPWLSAASDQGAASYADWYLLENSAALDALNVAAVSGPCERPHAEVAQAMAAGAGSLFALRSPEVVQDLAAARHATFLTKPRSMPYAEFYSSVAAFSPPASSLWRRALVLGPTPEFALLTASALSAPATLQPLLLGLTSIT
jgi:hypothetical protein